MTDNRNFQPIFEYFDEFKAEVNSRFDHLESRMDTLQTTVDNLAKMVKGFQEEYIVM
ncbi:MAG: hypothetical protein Q8P83_03020 [bacterium]|nr:hypothetical protein [bacterium]